MFSALQISAIIGLLLAFGVPQKNVDTVQQLLQDAGTQTQVATTTGSISIGITPTQQAPQIQSAPQIQFGATPTQPSAPVQTTTAAPTCTLAAAPTTDPAGNIVARVDWTSAGATGGVLSLDNGSNPQILIPVYPDLSKDTYVSGKLLGNTIAKGYTSGTAFITEPHHKDVFYATFTGPTGQVTCIATAVVPD